VSGGEKRTISRRDLLRQSLVSAAVASACFRRLHRLDLQQIPDSESFRGGIQLGVVAFSGEGRPPMDEAIGEELDGRLFTDLSKLTPENPITPSETFYVRTRASKLLDTGKPWAIRLGGLVESPTTLWAHELGKMARPMGLHLMECAGNTRSAHFGMLSAANWEGAPLEEILEKAKSRQRDARVLISGFDRYASESRTSVSGASWIFTAEQLKSSRAFLATKMNGQPLNADHGAPVRLVVPGWYGCACIKWVDEIAFVGEDAPATSQMQEYAGRTLQNGVPRLAKEYQPAIMEAGAMPVRIEKWSVGGKVKFRVVGIQWGGVGPIEGLEIRFNPDENYVAVEDFRVSAKDSWNLWSQAWTPVKAGRYVIRLRVKGANRVARRLDSGYYERFVEIAEA
jgi:DMSO/TMAO reductase YedYZ molybdopterin-dependent catalytic subunit